MRTLLLASALALSGCNIDFDADIPCDSSDDCPESQICDLTFFRCVDGESPDEDAGDPDTTVRDTAGDAVDATDTDPDGPGDTDPDTPPSDVPPSDAPDTPDTPDDTPDAGDVGETGDAGPDVPECVPTGAEICDGTDNDCNGTIDDPPVCDGPCGPGMALVDRGSGTVFCIDLYEASRPDATDSSAGTTSTTASSRENVVPWAAVGFSEAQAACTSSGKRLCSAFEWQSACQGAALTLYPYGNAYESDSCNGSNIPPLDGPTTTGQFDACVSVDGTFDQSGNLEEWTSDGVVRGGSFESPQLNLRCSSRATADPGGTPLPSYGFRCCQDPEQ